MTSQQAIAIVRARYRSAFPQTREDECWRILSAPPSSKNSVALTPYCSDFAAAIAFAAETAAEQPAEAPIEPAMPLAHRKRRSGSPKMPKCPRANAA